MLANANAVDGEVLKALTLDLSAFSGARSSAAI